MRFAVDLEISGIKIAQSLEFIRNEEAVTGYVYEYYGVGDKAIKTTALFTSNENYTIITGDKRETDDMLIEAYEEVYDSQTGEYIGAEVTETIKFVDYDTLWFNLYDVSGFSTVKVEDAQNGVNADTVYVNGNANPFEPKNFGGIGLDTLSRRYDIEMKEVWYIVATEKEGEVVYESEKALIPMLFVNKGKMSEFPEDVIEKNDYLSGVSLPDSDAITVPFESSQSTYLALKELVTYEELQEFINS